MVDQCFHVVVSVGLFFSEQTALDAKQRLIGIVKFLTVEESWELLVTLVPDTKTWSRKLILCNLWSSSCACVEHFCRKRG